MELHEEMELHERLQKIEKLEADIARAQELQKEFFSIYERHVITAEKDKVLVQARLTPLKESLAKLQNGLDPFWKAKHILRSWSQQGHPAERFVGDISKLVDHLEGENRRLKDELEAAQARRVENEQELIKKLRNQINKLSTKKKRAQDRLRIMAMLAKQYEFHSSRLELINQYRYFLRRLMPQNSRAKP